MKRTILTIMTVLLISTACTDATKSQYGGLGSKHLVEMYSGGELIRTWTSTGKVMSSSESDGYYFRDKKCNCNVEVSGDVVITRLD